MSDFLPEALARDIVAVERMKGRDFDRAEVHDDTVIFVKDDLVVHRHRVVCPGNYD